MRRAATCAGGVTLALLVLLGFGGAASRPGGFLIGLPHASQAILALAALALLGVVTRGAGLAPVLGLAVPAVLLLAGLRLPGVAALSGPPLLALALAGGAILLSQARPRISRAIFLPALLVLYALVAGRVQIQVGPQGDEPHYLMVAESLLRDHDLSLEKDYAEGRYLAFHDYPLEPHYRVRGRGGEIYSLHAVGLSLRTLPESLPGLLLDQEFGLLVYAPVFALALPGFIQHWRKDRRDSLVVLALVGAVFLTAGTWHMWRGGWNPPARFLVPLVPALALLVGAALQRGLTAGGALLVGWSVWVGLTGAADPRLVH